MFEFGIGNAEWGKKKDRGQMTDERGAEGRGQKPEEVEPEEVEIDND